MSTIKNEPHLTLTPDENLSDQQARLKQATSRLEAGLKTATQWQHETRTKLSQGYYRKFRVLAKRNLGPRATRRHYRATQNWASRTFIDAKIEKLFFHPTQIDVALDSLTIDSPNRQHAYDYKTIPVSVFHKAMSLLPASPEPLQFIDIGAGKGRSIMLASQYAFESIIGVEFARELYDDACMNKAQFPRPHMQCRNIDLVHADFLDYEIPHQNQLLFAHRPFDIDMYEKAVAHIKDSYIANPREIYLVVVEPPRFGKLSRLMKDTGIFENISSSGLGLVKRHLVDLYPVEIYKTRYRPTA